MGLISKDSATLNLIRIHHAQETGVGFCGSNGRLRLFWRSMPLLYA